MTTYLADISLKIRGPKGDIKEMYEVYNVYFNPHISNVTTRTDFLKVSDAHGSTVPGGPQVHPDYPRSATLDTQIPSVV